MNEFSKTCQAMEQLQAFFKGIRVSLSHLDTERGKLRRQSQDGFASQPSSELCKVLPRQMANKSLSPDRQKKISIALKERKEKTLSIVSKATKPLAIGTKDSQGPVSSVGFYAHDHRLILPEGLQIRN